MEEIAEQINVTRVQHNIEHTQIIPYSDSMDMIETKVSID